MLVNLDTKSLDRSDDRDRDLLRSVSPDEFLPRIDWWITVGGIVFLVIFSATIALVSVLKYKVTIKAPATVRPVGELRIVQAAIESQIESIEVKENQQVDRGDVIAYVDDSRLQTQKSQLQSSIEQAQLQLTQIAAQLQAITEQIAAETDRAKSTVALALTELRHSRREYDDRNLQSNAEVEEATANFNSTQEQLNQAQTELISLEADLKSVRASLNGAKSKRDRYTIIAQSGALSQNQLEEAQLDVKQKQQQVIVKQVAIQQQRQEIARQKQALAAARARLNNTRIALNPSQTEIEIARQQIFKAEAEAKATLAILNKEREQLIQQQIKTQNQLNRDRQELRQIETELEGTIIRAAASGIVQELNLRNRDQIVSPGDVIARIAPDRAPLEIRALVAAQDIDKVETGLEVQMRVSACPYPDYGTLRGTVTAIAPDASIPQNSQAIAQSKIASFNEAQATYNVTVKPKSLVLHASSKNCSIRSGMEGRADIISKEETVLTFILRKARLLVDI
ncbi:MAG: HlyD family efflux transporter periplasmic adaptor subunit [Pleurocapsa sp. MO_226.B13]|nr:HlyD family efflux transporter periplasmic adaptor subunit [Pleurocapsa sp. MO_226.B13]